PNGRSMAPWPGYCELGIIPKYLRQNDLNELPARQKNKFPLPFGKRRGSTVRFRRPSRSRQLRSKRDSPPLIRGISACKLVVSSPRLLWGEFGGRLGQSVGEKGASRRACWLSLAGRGRVGEWWQHPRKGREKGVDTTNGGRFGSRRRVSTA